MLRHRISLIGSLSCGSGGIGRRASLRSLWPQGRGGSSPPFRTISLPAVREEHGRAKDILLINPWIYDFTAYDFWTRSRSASSMSPPSSRSRLHPAAGRSRRLPRPLPSRPGRFPAGPGPTAAGPSQRRRSPSRTSSATSPGASRATAFPSPCSRRSSARAPRPDVVLVTSTMTYWYPGVQAAVDLVRRRFGRVPVILGGIYATLCPGHARRHRAPTSSFPARRKRGSCGPRRGPGRPFPGDARPLRPRRPAAARLRSSPGQDLAPGPDLAGLPVALHVLRELAPLRRASNSDRRPLPWPRSWTAGPGSGRGISPFTTTRFCWARRSTPGPCSRAWPRPPRRWRSTARTACISARSMDRRPGSCARRVRVALSQPGIRRRGA